MPPLKPATGGHDPLVTPPPRYVTVHAFHPTGKAQGGSAICAQRTLTFTPEVAVTTSEAQICAIYIQFEGLQLSLASLYCSPSCKLDAVDFDIFSNTSKEF